MSCKPDIQTTERMYELYRQGFSLAQIGTAFGVSRQTVYKRFARRSYQMRAAEPLPFIMHNGHKYTRRVNGYYARTNGQRDFLHRVIWQQANGPIPEGCDVHHIDEDKTNNALENLGVLPKAEHTRLHAHQ
ncbi:MAG TPA: HNH endonuclease [Sedimentisphaerales bacterium]|nr:HNH endonuclease [Sedimentisphaerales bacterium]